MQQVNGQVSGPRSTKAMHQAGALDPASSLVAQRGRGQPRQHEVRNDRHERVCEHEVHLRGRTAGVVYKGDLVSATIPWRLASALPGEVPRASLQPWFLFGRDRPLPPLVPSLRRAAPHLLEEGLLALGVLGRDLHYHACMRVRACRRVS